MVEEGRAKYADPSSMIRAAAMLLKHIGFGDRGERLEQALDVCGQFERKLTMTGRDTGATGVRFGDYILETLKDPKVAERWNAYPR
jgi:isocitrate dehydrogenase (NAD+)